MREETPSMTRQQAIDAACRKVLHPFFSVELEFIADTKMHDMEYAVSCIRAEFRRIMGDAC